jgi:hypothetical protein
MEPEERVFQEGARRMKRITVLVMLMLLTAGGYSQSLKECLVLSMPTEPTRSVVYTDPIQARLISREWAAPKAGDTVTFPDGSTRQWEAVTANADGWFEHPALRNGYAFCTVSSSRERVMLLEASGHVMVYVNGEPRVGDVYAHGYVRIPVLLKAGENQLLFRCSRQGRLMAQLAPPTAEAMLNVRDTTLPDLVFGDDSDVWLGIVVLNASTQVQRGLFIAAAHEGGRTAESPVPNLPPLGLAKVPVRLKVLPPRSAGVGKVQLRLLRREGKERYTLDTAEVTLRIREPHESQKRTFLSAIDGSVQYYAVLPAQRLSKDSPPPALVPVSYTHLRAHET